METWMIVLIAVTYVMGLGMCARMHGESMGAVPFHVHLIVFVLSPLIVPFRIGWTIMGLD